MVHDPSQGPSVLYNQDFLCGPGAAECTYNSVVPATGKSNPSFEIDLPSACELGPGTYWLSVRGVMDSADGAWFWLEGPTSIGDAYEFRDPSDIYTTGCTSWTPHSQCSGIGGAGDDLCFGLIGDHGQSSVIFSAGFENNNLLEWAAAVP